MGCGRNKDESSSSSHHERRHNEGCVCEVVKTILELQNRARRHNHHDCDSCGTSCFVEPLGGIKHQARNADTRVFMLLNKDGSPFTVVAKEDMDKRDDRRDGRDGKDGKDGKDGRNRNGNRFFTTPFFRVEDVFGDCCATLRALAPIGDNEGKGKDRGRNGNRGRRRDHDDDIIDDVVENGELNPDAFEDIEDFEKTETCVTVDLENFTAVQCIADVDLDVCKH